MIRELSQADESFLHELCERAGCTLFPCPRSGGFEVHKTAGAFGAACTIYPGTDRAGMVRRVRKLLLKLERLRVDALLADF